MIYLDNGATSMYKPQAVLRSMQWAMTHCANPGRGGYFAARKGDEVVYHTRELAAKRFECMPHQVVFTSNCTHGLNIALRSLVRPGMHVVISGFEHNAVTRVLHALGARITVAGRKLFDWEDTLEQFQKALDSGAQVAVFTYVSNVFGYVLPVERLAALCRARGVPFAIDAAQAAGSLPVKLKSLGADYIAMPGHKGLLGPQGTGILLCGATPEPLLYGGTGNQSVLQKMPEDLPERCEAGTLNVPGIAGLGAALNVLTDGEMAAKEERERHQASLCAKGLKQIGLQVFSGLHQLATVSFVPKGDCQEFAQALAGQGIAVRAGLHCAPLAHESAGTLQSGTVRVSFGADAASWQTKALLQAVDRLS